MSNMNRLVLSLFVSTFVGLERVECKAALRALHEGHDHNSENDVQDELPVVGLTQCGAACLATKGCESKDKSYCKGNGTCHGLYYENDSRETMCYESFDKTCIEERPVTCTHINADGSTSTYPPEQTTTVVPTVPIIGLTLCGSACLGTTGCEDRNKSYCKTNGTCSDLYFTDATHTATCFTPHDSNCPHTSPVTCTYINEDGSTSTYAPTVPTENPDNKPSISTTSIPQNTGLVGLSYCGAWCMGTKGCEDRFKLNGCTSEGMCPGLFFVDDSNTKACYLPFDDSCPTTSPIPCTPNEDSRPNPSKNEDVPVGHSHDGLAI